jgi:hypothetical protein
VPQLLSELIIIHFHLDFIHTRSLRSFMDFSFVFLLPCYFNPPLLFPFPASPLPFLPLSMLCLNTTFSIEQNTNQISVTKLVVQPIPILRMCGSAGAIAPAPKRHPTNSITTYMDCWTRYLTTSVLNELNARVTGHGMSCVSLPNSLDFPLLLSFTTS